MSKFIVLAVLPASLAACVTEPPTGVAPPELAISWQTDGRNVVIDDDHVEMHVDVEDSEGAWIDGFAAVGYDGARALALDTADTEVVVCAQLWSWSLVSSQPPWCGDCEPSESRDWTALTGPTCQATSLDGPSPNLAVAVDYQVQPYAAPKWVTTTGPIDIEVLSGSWDVNGDSFEVASATALDIGTVTINPDDTIRFVPPPAYVGNTWFQYTIEDSTGRRHSNYIYVDVEAAPDA